MCVCVCVSVCVSHQGMVYRSACIRFSFLPEGKGQGPAGLQKFAPMQD